MDLSLPPPGFSPCPRDDGNFALLVGQLYSKPADPLPRFAFLPTAQHANAAGNIHGGMLLTLADQVLGLSVRHATGSHAVVTVSLTAEFVAAARPGAWIEGQSEIIRQTRSIIFVRGTLWQRGHVVLTGTGVWKRVRAAS